MSTPFQNIIDLSMVTIRDYKLDNLIMKDEQAYIDYMTGFVVRAVPRFTGCLTDLTYDLETREFVSNLDIMEQNILASLVTIVWFESLVNDVTELNALFQNRDQKTHSAASNLKSKTIYLKDLNYKLDKEISDYQNAHFDSIFEI